MGRININLKEYSYLKYRIFVFHLDLIAEIFWNEVQLLRFT
jgi:hypothetical protein